MTRSGRSSAPGPFRVLLAILLGVAGLAATAAQAGAQEKASPPADSAYAPVPISELPEAMATAIAFVRHLDDTLGFRAPVQNLASRTEKLLLELARRAPATDTLLSTRVSLRTVESLVLEWEGRQAEFDDAIGRGRTLEGRLFARAYSLDSLRRVYENTAGAYLDELPESRAATIDSLQSWIRERQTLEGVLGGRLDSLLVTLGDGERRIAQTLATVHRAESELRGNLLTRDSDPLWELLAAAGTQDPMSRSLQDASQNWAKARQYLARHTSDLLLLGLFFLLISALLLFSRRQVREWAGSDGTRQAVGHVLGRPFSAAILSLILVLVYVGPTMPLQIRDALGILVVIPFLRVALGLISAPYRADVVFLAALFFLDKLIGLFGESLLLWRFGLLVRCGLGGLVLLRVARRLTRDASADVTHRRLLAWLSVAGVAALAIAFVANIFGFAALTVILTEGVLNSAFAGLVLVVVYPIINGLGLLVLQSPIARRSRYLARVGSGVLKGLERLAKVALTLTWVWVVLNLFRAARPLGDRLTQFLTARFEMGAASISLAGIFGFIFIAWLGVTLARVVSAILEEDILDRMGMPRGVPAAIGRVTQVALIALVFALAAATAGVELSQLALLTGALGVGIGFGMQNVVNNFMSGLILMFERPIQIGDIVEVGALTGKVHKIGFRSSTIKTFDGSFVIVPNGNLISQEVVNWTLLDQSRRISLDVGVAYGTDPERVLEILLETARAHPEVAEDPEPVALFLAFGDNSLNFVLRYWTFNFPRWYYIASEVTVAVNKALADAGIEIPFPQRTLHVASWNPEAQPPQGKPGPSERT